MMCKLLTFQEQDIFRPRISQSASQTLSLILFAALWGRSALADIYIGNHGIWKGDERQMIQELRVLHGITD